MQMSEPLKRYSLEFRPLEMSQQPQPGVLELEIVAQPDGPGSAISTRSRQWLPIFERLCSLVSSSPFQRKAMQRTLAAGVSMHVLDRSNGKMRYFSEEEIAALTDTRNAA
jgi:hypothetical protein